MPDVRKETFRSFWRNQLKKHAMPNATRVKILLT